RGDLRLIALGGPVHRDLRGIPDAVQQVRGAPQRVPDMEQPADQRGDPGQRPPLILTPPPRGRAAVQRGPQPGQLRAAQPAHRPARPFRGQGDLTASTPAPPPHIRRIRRDPQPPRHLRRLGPLREPLCGLQPYFLTPCPPSGGQATTIRIPHNTAVAPQAATVTTTRRPGANCENPDNSTPVGIPFASLNARTGHRSCAPEDYRRYFPTLRQGAAAGLNESENRGLGGGLARPTWANANRTTGLPNSYAGFMRLSGG